MNKNRIVLLVFCVSLSAFISSMTPEHQLIRAVRWGNIQQAQQAINAGADVNFSCCDASDSTVLHLAVAGSVLTSSTADIKMVKLLMAAGADVNARDCNGSTPLHAVVMCNKVDLAKLLIENGADISLKDTLLNSTVLELARKIGKQEMISVLTATPSLKDLSARVLRRLVRQGELTLEQVKNSVPHEVYELVTEYL